MNQYALKGRLIDGIKDEAIENGIIIVKEDKIIYAGISSGYNLPNDIKIIELPNSTILPGFIDCHTHVSGNEGSSLGKKTNYDNLLTASSHLRLFLEAGFTFIRDMTPFSSALSRAVHRGDIEGPGIMSGGQVLSPTAGHTDIFTGMSLDSLRNAGLAGSLADGIDECLKTVRRQFREGAEFIKICATGGVSSAVDGLEDIQYSEAEMTVMVEEARRHGTYVAAHCSSLAGTYQALKCGIASIEHGIDLDDRCIKIMAEKNIPVITTAYVLYLVSNLTDYPEHMIRKGKITAKSHQESMRKAHKAGINIAYGTDFSNSKNTPYLRNGLEFKAIVNYGFTPMEAIKIGTINGAKVCKREKLIGSLEAGKQADITIVEGDPLQDIDVLTDAKHVSLVIQNGKIKKGTLGV